MQFIYKYVIYLFLFTVDIKVPKGLQREGLRVLQVSKEPKVRKVSEPSVDSGKSSERRAASPKSSAADTIKLLELSSEFRLTSYL